MSGKRLFHKKFLGQNKIMGVVILSDDDLCERVTDIAHEVKGESKPPQRLASYLMDFFGKSSL
ncbi:hypothetical protein ACV8RZ_004391 [Escherichia coli]|nr:hypothetical protein [Escherichia coli]EES4549709.1 hypothetical protein [Escherichia coli]EFI3472767.1 hypothetical protein [Escherichia coli]EIB5727690.1 hypothetical protein [Escherichia coli]EIG3175388.1 hypothetical protein [Escherichia coli]